MSPISDLISHLKPSLSQSDYEKAKQNLDFRESRLKIEKEEITHKFTNLLKDNDILTKQLEQWKREHGELLLNKREADEELAESRIQSLDLKETLASANTELQRLKCEIDEKECKIRDLSEEVRSLKEQNLHLSEENKDLVTRKAAMEAELGLRRPESESEGSRIGRLEEQMGTVMEELKKGEKDRREKMEVLRKNERLQRKLEVVIDAATTRFRELEQRLLKLEPNEAALNNSSRSGVQQVSPINVNEHQESFGSDVKPEGLIGNQLVPRITHFEEKMGSSMPSPSIFDISDSDDDDDDDDGLPLSNGLKRNLSEVPEKSEKPGASTKKHKLDELKDSRLPESENQFQTPASPLSNETEMQLDNPVNQNLPALKACAIKIGVNQNLPALRSCAIKIGVKLDRKHISYLTRTVGTECQYEGESGNRGKEWQDEEDMLDALRNDTELCMKAICALYRQHWAPGSTSSSVSRLRGFSDLYVFRGNLFGNFLLDGDAKGEMKRSPAELQKFVPGGANECRRIAFGHSEQLFEIYKNKEDPFFAP